MENSCSSRADYVIVLKDNVCNVHFTKRDGTMRWMLCTLREDFIPDEALPQTRTEQDTDLSYIRVWDCENDGWRTIRLDSINHFGIYPSL